MANRSKQIKELALDIWVHAGNCGVLNAREKFEKAQEEDDATAAAFDKLKELVEEWEAENGQV
jgi:predicted translin family RNA/ssDNA-binding protein